jgi:hypothetical protein
MMRRKRMNVYAVFHATSYEGSELLGIYQYLSQAQEAEYAWRLQWADSALYTGNSAWTEIREIALGAAPTTDAGKIVED